MAELEAAPLPEGNGLGPQGAVAATKIDAGSFDLPRNHDDFDDGDDDDFGHFATAAAAPPVPAADVNHIPAADDAVTSEVAVTCDSTNGTLLPSLCLGDSDDDSATSQDTSGLVRQASAELPFSGETGGVKREDSFDDFQQAQAVAPPFEAALAPVDEGSDFADFEQACDTVVADSCEWGDSKGDGFADFAAFGDASKTAVEDGDWADDDWKSFANAEDGEATSVVSPVALPQQGTVSGQLVPGEGSFENLFQSAYTLEGASLSPVSAEDEDFVALSCCEVHVRLWEQLEDLDRAPSLKFSWNGSHSCQHLLQSLSIDSRNIAGADSAIPPAQFDWTSSGLVNPLEQPAASTLLDLEFLSSLSSATVGSSPPTSSLEKEFLELSGSAAAPVSSQSSCPVEAAGAVAEQRVHPVINTPSALAAQRRSPGHLGQTPGPVVYAGARAHVSGALGLILMYECVRPESNCPRFYNVGERNLTRPSTHASVA
ncbi:aftiphilin-like isoform X2 [Dermacentor silvarum]|uniref:aftiphilin-like isoform X2 n=1 Tax=Dermacentor silvarum TaxID=543639 RepID=UPI00189A7705|nr:aftiphilin-like isoform X2 [Dermacentor silvarum]